MPGEVQKWGTFLQVRLLMAAVCGTADFERSWTLTSIPALAAHLAASYQSVSTCGFWWKPPCRRYAMSRSRTVSALCCGELGHAPVENRFLDSHGVWRECVLSGERWETRES